MTGVNWKLFEEIKKNPIKLGWYLGYRDLTEIHNTWIKNLFLAGKDYCMQAHRNSYKTTCLVVGIIWDLLFDSDCTFAIIRKSESGAIAILLEIAKHLEGERFNALFVKLFGFTLPKVNYNQRKLYYPLKTEVTKEASIEVYGKGSSITGAHFKKIIIDDIVTDRDRYSKAEREDTKRYVMELNNIKTISGVRIATGTPWHKDDAFSILPKAVKYPLGSIKIAGLTEAKIEELKRSMTASLFAANYYLKHIADEKRIFGDPLYSEWLPEFRPIAYLDPAYHGTNTTALALAYYNGKDSLCYVTGFVWTESVVSLYNVVVKRLNDYKAGTLYIETNADKGMSAAEIEKIYPAVERVYEHENKHKRIIHFVKRNYGKLVFSSKCQLEFANQVIEYEEGLEPDDAPDALAGVLRVLDDKLNAVEGGVEDLGFDVFGEEMRGF
jgi:hypothetical protein